MAGMLAFAGASGLLTTALGIVLAFFQRNKSVPSGGTNQNVRYHVGISALAAFFFFAYGRNKLPNATRVAASGSPIPASETHH